jgi:hypothetical protein
MNVWDLPGPARFLGDALDALKDGLNVVAARPLTQPRDLVPTLDDGLSRAGFTVERLNAAKGVIPLNLLYDQLVSDERPGVLRSVVGLVQTLRPGLLLLVQGICDEDWAAWAKFMLEFEHVGRAFSTLDRPLLLLEIVGVGVDQRALSAPAVRHLAWRGIVSELDMTVYVEQLARARHPSHGKVVLRTIAKLAAWDFALAEFLASQEQGTIFAPLSRLRAAYQQGELEAPTEATWEAGGLQVVDGFETRHAALLVLDGDPKRELAMRVWAAQAAEILPIVEVARREIVDRMRARVSPPFIFGEETFADLDDLEIGQLSHLAYTRRLPDGVRKELATWKEVRNSLAHLEPLTAASVDEVTGWLARGRSRQR